MTTKVMELICDAEGVLRERSNRFLAVVDIVGFGDNEEVHVHDPGRLKELLYPGNRVRMKRAAGKKRKTKWDMIAARYGDEWILVHSGYHRAISEWVIRGEQSPFHGVANIRPEVTVGHSRLDFVLTDDGGKETGVEVKGCTLAVDGVALFPDAPTERGRRHLEVLMDMRANGKNAALIVLVFRHDAGCFRPNELTDPKFADVFRKAVKQGVDVFPMVFRYDGKWVRYMGEIPVCGD